jgi:hypothetical protein
MRTIFLIFTAIWLTAPVAHGEGTVAWDHVKAEIGKTDPALIEMIEKNFVIDSAGWGVRFGSHGVHPELAGIRTAPYYFEATHRATQERYGLRFAESEDFQFTGRYTFTWRVLPKQ